MRKIKRMIYYGKGTFFSPGQGACGNYATSQDHITALSVSQFSGGQPCGRKILVTNQDNQKSVQVFVQDECQGCQGGDLDLSKSAFESIGNEDSGVLNISWSWV